MQIRLVRAKPPADILEIVVSSIPSNFSVVLPLSGGPAVARDDHFDVTAKKVRYLHWGPDGGVILPEGGNLFSDNGFGPDFDPDGDVFSIIAVNGDSSKVGKEVMLSSGGSVFIFQNGRYSSNQNLNSDYYELPAANSGASNITLTDSFTYTITGGSTATVTFTVTGVDDADLLLGTTGNDTLDAGERDDTLRGFAGDDILKGGRGGDILDGGEGFDIADYSGATAPVFISLATGYANDNARQWALNDQFISIEGLIGTDHNDRLVGSHGDNVIRGGAGDDTLQGYRGADTLDGGDGIDIVIYPDATAGLYIDLSNRTTSGGYANSPAIGDYFLNIEILNGTQWGDVLIGDDLGNVLVGLEGRDTLRGGLGDDTLLGGTGYDSLDGGAGFDIADYSGTNISVNVSLETGYAGGGRGSASYRDRWVDIEGFAGSAGSDRLNGNDEDNHLLGNGGYDTLRGRGGADTLDGGGGGMDVADYEDSDAFVSVNLKTGDTSGGGAGNDAEGDVFVSIEGLIGSRWDDTLIGDDGDNLMQGRLGQDYIDGGDGIDTATYVDSETFVNVSLLATNSDGSGYAGGQNNRSHAYGDKLFNIENLTGSAFDDILAGNDVDNLLRGESGNDSLIGRGGSDTLEGGTGNDSLFGGDGADTLQGEAGNDSLVGGDGADSLDGGTGDDTLVSGGGADTLHGRDGFDYASYVDSPSFVNVSLQTGKASGGHASHAAGDKITFIEGLIGSAHGDALAGDDKDNVLNGMDGDDILDGRRGADTLIGGLGSDTVTYQDSYGFVNVSLKTGYAGGGDFNTATGDVFQSIENLTGSIYDDALTGDDGNNVLNGWVGNDTLRGWGGADVFEFHYTPGNDVVLDFEDGVDMLSFESYDPNYALSRDRFRFEDSGADAIVHDGFGSSIRILNAAGKIDFDDFLT